MTLSAPALGLPDPPVLSTMTDALTAALAAGAAAGVSGTWPSANAAYFFPVRIADRRTYTTAWWLNGATAAGNIDVGLYTIAGSTATRVVATGAVAQAGVSAIQTSAITSTTVAPGLYYLTMSCSSASSTMWRGGSSTTLLRASGVCQMAAAHPLPASGTVTAMGTFVVPVFGLSESSVI